MCRHLRTAFCLTIQTPDFREPRPQDTGCELSLPGSYPRQVVFRMEMVELVGVEPTTSSISTPFLGSKANARLTRALVAPESPIGAGWHIIVPTVILLFPDFGCKRLKTLVDLVGIEPT